MIQQIRHKHNKCRYNTTRQTPDLTAHQPVEFRFLMVLLLFGFMASHPPFILLSAPEEEQKKNKKAPQNQKKD
jgi:hypothetical protein